jgi:hypothetical protein
VIVGRASVALLHKAVLLRNQVGKDEVAAELATVPAQEQLQQKVELLLSHDAEMLVMALRLAPSLSEQ